MELLYLKRTYHPQGTNGQLFIDETFECNTIELPWVNNQKNCSCIPEGNYRLDVRTSKKHGQHIILRKVPDRSYILFHPANNALKELKGCIAPVTTLTGPGTGTESKRACQSLFNKIIPAIQKGEEVWLFIFNNTINYPN